MNPTVSRLCSSLTKNFRRHSFISLKLFITAKPRSIHAQSKQPNLADLASPISNLLRNGGTWDNLTATFNSLPLTSDLTERVLLDLKEPSNAKKALAFFHWSSHHRRFNHPLRAYCIIVHILVRANLLIDARALLQSAITKNSGFSVVEILFGTFEATDSSPRVFDLLIQTYSKLRMVELALHASCFFEDRGFSSCLSTFNNMIHVAQRSGQSDVAWKVYEQMIAKRVYPNESSVETVIDLMRKEGTLRKTVDILDRICPKRCAPVVIVNTAMALRMVRDNRVDEVIVLLRRLLQKDMVLDVIVHSLIIFAHCTTGELGVAREAYGDMINGGFGSNAFVHTAFIGAHCEEGRIEEALVLMREMSSIGLEPYGETYSFLIRACSKAERMEESLAFYEDMLVKGFLPGCSACNEMMGRLCEAGEVEKADEILTALLDRGFVPNATTYSKLVEGFGEHGKMQDMLKVYYEMEHRGLDPGVEIYTSLVKSLCRCGRLKEAEKFLGVMREKLLTPTRRLYDSLIRGYCKKGDTKSAFCFYDDMKKSKQEPSDLTFMTLVKSTISTENIRCDYRTIIELLEQRH